MFITHMPVFRDRSTTEDGIRLTKLPILGYSWYWGGFGYWLGRTWLVAVWLIPVAAGIYTLFYYTEWTLTASDIPVVPRAVVFVSLWALALGGSVWSWRERKHFTSVRSTPSTRDEQQRLHAASAQATTWIRLALPFVASFLVVPSVLLMYRAWRWQPVVRARLRADVEVKRKIRTGSRRG